MLLVKFTEAHLFVFNEVVDRLEKRFFFDLLSVCGLILVKLADLVVGVLLIKEFLELGI